MELKPFETSSKHIVFIINHTVMNQKLTPGTVLYYDYFGNV